MSKKISHKSKTRLKMPTKTPEQIMAEEHLGIMNTIITQTFTRHSGLSEKTYLKRIGFKDIKISEEKAVRIAKFNAMVDLTRVLLGCISKANLITEFYRTYLKENNLAEEGV